uniref:Go opsin n=1 Tax=Branchiostoma lanceolatum TaxID=7740 RepID=A0A2Z4C042_BRALA|nr:Go opsin [Branchiostoma lanceolatum]
MFNSSDGKSSPNDALFLWHYDGEFLDKAHIQPLTPQGYLATAVYLTFIGCIATLGNASVIAVYIRQKKFRSKPHNILILNLAASDLGISIFGYPFCTASGYAGYWLFGDAVCQLYGFMCYTLSMSSLNTLVVIAGFRYISLCHPQYAYRLTHRVTAYSLIGLWFYGLLWTVPPLVGWSSYTYEIFGTSCSIKWMVENTSEMLYVVGSCIFCYLLHLLLLAFFYYKIAKRMRKLNLRGQHTVPAARGRRDFVTSSRMKSESRATLMCFLMVILFVVAWTPYTVSSFWSILVQKIPLAAATYPTMFAKSSCVFNPIIYAIAHKKFRSFLFQTCCPWLYRRVGLGEDNAYMEQRRRDRLRKQKGQIFCVQYTNGNVYIGSHGSRGCWSEDGSNNGENSGSCRYHRARASFSTLRVDNLTRQPQTGNTLSNLHSKGRKYIVQAQVEPVPRTDNDTSSGEDSVHDLSCIDFAVI